MKGIINDTGNYAIGQFSVVRVRTHEQPQTGKTMTPCVKWSSANSTMKHFQTDTSAMGK
jgi:hypothetical protein